MTKKMETKRQSFLVRVAMTLLFTVLTTVTAWAAEWPEYVTDIIVVGGSESEVNSAKSYNSGYTWCSMDLNKNAGGDYIYFGYKKSRTANTNGGYITDIIVIDAEGTNPPSTVTYDGRTYYLCSYDGGSHFEDVKGNLNSNCGSGWNIYLYYTKQEYSSTKRAVSSIDVNSTKAGSINCYYKNGSKEEEQIDLNRGISGSSDVYMHLSTATKVNRPYPEPSMASNLVYDGQPKQLISSSYSNSNSGTLYYRVSTTGSYTSTVANVTATTAGTHTVYYYSASSSYGNSSESYAHSKTVTIAKAPNSGVTVSCADIAEDNAPAPQLGGTNLSTGAVSYTYCTTQNGSYSSTVPTEPGTYYVKATVAGDDNYNEFTTEAASFKIIRDWTLHSTGNSEDDPYVISTTDELNLLAQRVNSGTDYKDKFFKLDADITYSHTTDWNDVTSTENNFTRIGDANNTFKGTFDGQRYTIKGIRYTSSNNNLGLFGKITGGATVKNVILSDARIIGKDNCGGIAGNCEQSTITNCWVKSNVCIGNKDYKGGIAGYSYKGTISGCRSEATLTAYSSSNIYYGGIAGQAFSSEVSQCVVVGATIPNAGNRGAIVGNNYQSTLTSNYYTACTVVGVANAANVGCQGGDANGARQAVAIGAATGVTITPVGTETNYNLSGITAYEGNNGIIYGGTLYAGATETVTLTIAYTVPDGCTLNGYTDGNGNALADNGDGTYTLTMTGAAATVTPDVTDLWGIASGRDGSTAAKAYRITTPAGLDLLAQKVNGGTEYQNTYFELGDDIVYGADALTLDLDNDGNNDSNYMPVGKNFSSFSGNFDGQGHTISGISVNANEMYYIGVFGFNDGTVKNLTVSDCLFAGSSTVGAIAGMNRGTVENCHVAASVSVTGNNRVGGVVSKNERSVIGCTSAATLSTNKEYARYFGGIAGSNTGTLTDNLFTGTIGEMPDGSWGIGAITGYHYTDYGGTLTNNFHTCSGMGGVGNLNDATNTDQDGAQFAYEFPTANGAMGNTGSTYGTGDYTGITAYANGLAYNGKYYCPSLWGGSGTEADPYIIVNTQGMDKLATDVNGGNYYDGSYFVLGNDIVYGADVLTLDLDNDGNNDSNYMPVGKDASPFKGHFDGQGHTISGISVNANGVYLIGVFGRNNGTVKNLTVSDCLFAGDGSVGAIAGLNWGTVENCHVAAYVSVIGDIEVGGVVGANDGGFVLGCTSAATLSAKEYPRYFGGIAGSNAGTLTDNLFTGTIDGMPVGPNNFSIGAITGYHDTDYGTLTNNFHTCSGMGGVGNDNDATNTDQAGAQFAVSRSTQPDASIIGEEKKTYGGTEYTGITAYEHGLYYNGKYYYFSLWGGSGTEADPYVIYNTEGLDKLATNVNGGNGYQDTYFVLGNDIAYSYAGLAEGESNYTAIGKYNGSNDIMTFSGHFDGKGHTISGIRITKDGMGMKYSYQGVFGYIRNATVKNVKLTDTRITAAGHIGGIAGFNSAATIENCHVTNTVTIQSNGYSDISFGGIAGELHDYNGVDPCVRGCTSAASVSGYDYVGGIVGKLYDGSIIDCLYLGTSVTGTKYIGAIVGYNINNTLSNNYHTLSGVGGCDGSDVAGACFAYEYPAATGAMGAVVSTYGTGDYTGMTVYTDGLAYNGKYYCPLPWTGDGTAEHPFVISTTDGLNKLAIKVNAGTSYSGKYFELGNDITYSYDGLAEGESNFTTIGENGYWFSGTFDGKGHTISGIRISDTNGTRKAIFCRVNGTVKNLVVSDCSMEAYYWIGGIVSYLRGGTIENCHVLSDVTLTGNGYIGGIAADNYGGTVKGCTSAARITGTKSGDNNARYLGGIAGYNGSTSTLTDNLFTGTISGDIGINIGAIVGQNDSDAAILTNNYHTLSGMGGVGNENDATSSDEDGATIAYELAAANGAMGAVVSTYGTGDYTGITAYQNGLAYNGKYYCPSLWGGSGTEADPYVIYNTQGMDKLATDVNGGNYYINTYFVLGNDIAYAPDVLTLDLDGDGNNDSNYMPVGKDASPFMGNFDGQGHTISGISVNANGMDYIGVFGRNDGTVKNLTVSDCLFAGSMDVGAIAGFNWDTVENCHVAAGVSITGNNGVGGVVGNNEGSVLGCTSAAALSAKEYARYFGGIAGRNSGTLTDNLFTGTIDKMPDGSWSIGAITGVNDTELGGTLTNNFHTCSGMGGVGNSNDATNTDQDGAQLAISSTTKPDAATIGTAGTPYAEDETYQGITPYSKGLYYDGRYYWHEAFLRGDANGDGSVTITDAVAIVNYILGNPSANFNLEAANVNGDTDDEGKPKITITDAVAVVNIILNSGSSSAPQLDMTEPEPMVDPE